MQKSSTMRRTASKIFRGCQLTIGMDLRAVVAVARKLAVLLHRLWVSGEVYEPLRNSHKLMRAAA